MNKLPKKITVLSLFDGISCGQQALKELGANVLRYYASEINVEAMKISYKHFPETKYIGYVENVKPRFLPKIDLVLAGSPCQGFSMSGKLLNFEDPRSKLFFEFVRILKEVKKLNPQVLFLLENVRMKKEWQDIISANVGVEPVLINSSLLTAQSRSRLYWANFPITIPKDKGIVLKDILQAPFYLDESGKKRTDNNVKVNFNGYLNVLDPNKKAACLTVRDRAKAIALSLKTYREMSLIEMERLQTLPDNYTAGIPKTHRHQAIGNGWTVAVIKHILKPII